MKLYMELYICKLKGNQNGFYTPKPDTFLLASRPVLVAKTSEGYRRGRVKHWQGVVPCHNS